MRSRLLTFSLVTEERVVIMNGCANRSIFKGDLDSNAPPT